jgi:hypothetical protein
MSENVNIGSTEDFDFGYSTENYDAGCEWTELPNEPDYSDPIAYAMRCVKTPTS